MNERRCRFASVLLSLLAHFQQTAGVALSTFIFGDAWSRLCPLSYAPITDAIECEVASSRLGTNYISEAYDNSKFAVCNGKDCTSSGCGFTQLTEHFSSPSSSSKLVCKLQSFWTRSTSERLMESTCARYQYKFTKKGKSYYSPHTTLKWSYDTYEILPGNWTYDGGGMFTCDGVGGPEGSFGIGCSTGFGDRYQKVVPAPLEGNFDPDLGTGKICQPSPLLWEGNTCAGDVELQFSCHHECVPYELPTTGMTCETDLHHGAFRSTNECAARVLGPDLTFWHRDHAVHFGSWVKVGFPKPMLLKSINIFYYAQGCYAEIQHSADGNTWITACGIDTSKHDVSYSCVGDGLSAQPVSFVRISKNAGDRCDFEHDDTYFRLTGMSFSGCPEARSCDTFCTTPSSLRDPAFDEFRGRKVCFNPLVNNGCSPIALHSEAACRETGLDFCIMPNPTTSTTTIIDNSVTNAMTSVMTSSTTVRPIASFRGELTMSVKRATEFIKLPNLKKVLTEAIAALYNVSVSWVHKLTYGLKMRRRLRDASSVTNVKTRSLLGNSDGEVEVDWTIEIPPDSNGDDIIVTIYAEQFNAKAISEVTETINTVVSRNYGSSYDVNVSWVYVIPEEETPIDKGNNDAGSNTIIYVIVIGAITSLGALIGVVVLYIVYGMRRRVLSGAPRKRLNTKVLRDGAMSGGDLTTFTLQELLSPPDVISGVQGKELRTSMRSLCGKASLSSCKVFLTYSPGTRDADGEGYGPGSFYAAAVTKVLHDHGVWCFSDLMLPETCPKEDFDAVLSNATSDSVLVVLQTAGLYQSKETLRQIYVGQQRNLKTIPLRFEDDLPKASETWTSITRTDLDGVVMVSAVQSVYMKLNSIPSPPYTVPTQPFILKDFVQDLRLDLMLEDDQVVDQFDDYKFPNPSTVGSKKKASDDSKRLLDHTDSDASRKASDCSQVEKEVTKPINSSSKGTSNRKAAGLSSKGTEVRKARSDSNGVEIPRSRSDPMRKARSDSNGVKLPRSRSDPNGSNVKKKEKTNSSPPEMANKGSRGRHSDDSPNKKMKKNASDLGPSRRKDMV